MCDGVDIVVVIIVGQHTEEHTTRADYHSDSMLLDDAIINMHTTYIYLMLINIYLVLVWSIFNFREEYLR